MHKVLLMSLLCEYPSPSDSTVGIKKVDYTKPAWSDKGPAVQSVTSSSTQASYITCCLAITVCFRVSSPVLRVWHSIYSETYTFTAVTLHM